MDKLTVVQKAGCEAAHRALAERDVDYTGLALQRACADSFATKRSIADYVQCLPADRLRLLVEREIEAHGPLRGGYTLRWGARPSGA